MSSVRTDQSTTRRQPVQIAAMVVGAVFALVGILGFIPGITTHYDQLGFWGPGSMAMLLGLFMVSVLHNIVHLLFGVGILMSRTPSEAKKFLIGSGIVYAILTIFGILVPQDTMANFPPINNADNWLHLVLTVALLALGIGLSKGTRANRADSR